MTVDHQFIPYANEALHPSGCVRCHRPRSAHPAPPAPEVVSRNHAAEVLVLHDAVRGTMLDVAPLWAFASRRAQQGGVRVAGRDLRGEALEEAADLLNYVVWEVVYGDLDPVLVPSRLGAIRKLAEVWELLRV